MSAAEAAPTAGGDDGRKFEAASKRLRRQINTEAFWGIERPRVIAPGVRIYPEVEPDVDNTPRQPGDLAIVYKSHEDGTYDIFFGVVGEDGEVHPHNEDVASET